MPIKFGNTEICPHLGSKKQTMSNYDNNDARLCLNCGEPISGRADKLFCCGKCKNEWHNRISGTEKRRRERIFAILWKNYKLLEMILESDEHAPEIAMLADAGFRQEYITGFRHLRGGRDEYRCFDISYNKTETRLYNIRRAPEIV